VRSLASAPTTTSRGAPATGAAPTTSVAGLTRPSIGSTASVAVLTRAIATTQSVPSGHFTVNSAFYGGTEPDSTDDFMNAHAQPGAIEGTTGVFEHAHHRASVTTDAFGLKGLVVDGTHAYAKVETPTKTTQWHEIPAHSVTSGLRLVLAGVDPTDPAAMLRRLALVGTKAKVIATDDVAGTPTVEYQAHADLNVWNAANPSSLPAGMTIVRGRGSATNVRVDLWVDAAGRVRRLWFVASYHQSDTLTYNERPGQTKTTVSTSYSEVMFDLALTHLGEPVVIKDPSPDEVTPLDTGSGANGNALTN
jgi:hypothetical protein